MGLAGLIALASASVAAPAAAFPRLKLPRIPEPPPIHLPPTSIPKVARSVFKYGARDRVAVDALDEAAAAVVSDVDERARRVTANAEAQMRIKQCGGDALRSAGESYKSQVEEAERAGETSLSPPDFDEVSAAVASCLDEHFPDESLDVTKRLADSLVNVAETHAKDATAADPAAAVLAEWLRESGIELSDDHSSFPWWPVLVALAVLGILALAVATARSKP